MRHPGSTGTNAHVPSPVLVDGKLLAMLPESGLPSAGDYVRCNCFLYGYDAGTGALLWKADTAGGVLGEITGTLYDSGDYQIAHDGLVFSYGARLDAIRQDDGAAVFRSSSILWRRPGRCYSPLALAGPHLFVGDLGNWFGMKKSSFHASALSVTTVGRRPVVLARNRVERTNAAPVFDEDRLYVRPWYSLLCLAVTGEEGRRFEAETVARVGVRR